MRCDFRSILSQMFKVGSRKSAFPRARFHRHRASSSFGRRLSAESLEDRRLLAIIWSNEGDATSDDDDFTWAYGDQASTAREIVNRAISDWEKAILDFNFDSDDNPSTNNEFTLTIVAADLDGFSTGTRGLTAGWDDENPTSAFIAMDNIGGLGGWFFDQTPQDDAEFTAIASPFHSTFIDVNQKDSFDNQINYNDFYRTILHEIGHAVGLASNAGLAIDDFLTSVGGGLYEFVNSDPSAPFGVEAVFESTGHLDGNTHPNDLMNPGSTVPPPGADPIPTTRQLISDLDIQILADAYGYSVALPSGENTFHATLNEQSGQLLLQGVINDEDDTIDVEVVGNELRVEINDTVETFALGLAKEILVAGHGGTDSISVEDFGIPVRFIDFVVSSNEDAVEPGGGGDGVVDLDDDAPGNQVTLRAAIQEANLAGAPTSIYAPALKFVLTRTGTEVTLGEYGDLDVSGDVTVVGVGAGLTVIDAGGASGIGERVIDVVSAGSLELSRVTVTGGQSSSDGGGIRVQPFGGSLSLSDSAVVGNRAVNTSSTIRGGGIYKAGTGTVTILNSVIANNEVESTSSSPGGGGIYRNGSDSMSIGNTIVAQNTANFGEDDLGSSSSSALTSLGNNRLTSVATSLASIFTVDDDLIDNSVDYVVTTLQDTAHSSPDPNFLSLREAILEANANSGSDLIWLPPWLLRLTRAGADSGSPDASVGDLDILEDVTLLGISSTDTVIDATAIADEVFEEIGGADLTADRLTSIDG